jgi:hypothetical protein
MLFLLATPEYTNVQSNTTKVRVHLRNGVAEVFDQHEDLMGKVENNLLEVETNFENKVEKLLFILQDAVFIVSNKGLESNIESKGTGIYVYAKRVREINSTTSLDEIAKQYDQKYSELEKATTKAEEEKDNSIKTNSKIFLLKEEVEFLKRTLVIVKDLKK